jgi:dTDP-4-amino-4,6-dideoxygalactose transaminase
MCALLLSINPGDEVILPSFTFVSTANAFALRGATLVFADCEYLTPNISPASVEKLISPRTKAIVLVHYAGISCDLDKFLSLSDKYGVHLIEDAAQAIDSYYRDQPLGSIGTFGTFSFHETKNIISGEGGLLSINNSDFFDRAEVIREKGTNRSSFFRGEIDKYGWVDIGSSFLPSDIIAAFLYAQLEELEEIQKKRLSLYEYYWNNLSGKVQEFGIRLPYIPDYATNNAHIFYMICKTQEQRHFIINELRHNGIQAVFHYLSLHKSSFYADRHDGRDLPNADIYSDRLLRLPLYYELSFDQVDLICDTLLSILKIDQLKG